MVAAGMVNDRAGSAEGEAFATFCKVITAHLMKFGVVMSTQAVAAACLGMISFGPRWAWRFMFVSAFAGDVVGASLAAEVIKMLRLG